MSLLSIRLPEELEKKLAEEAKLTRKKRAEVVRDALGAYLKASERARIESVLRQAARMADQDQALAIAEEFLPLENEALDIAEDRLPGTNWPKEKWWKE